MSGVHGSQLQVRFAVLSTFYSLSGLLEELEGICRLPIGDSRLLMIAEVVVRIAGLITAPETTLVAVNGLGRGNYSSSIYVKTLCFGHVWFFLHF